MRIDLRKWSIVAVPGTIVLLAAAVYLVLAASLPRRGGTAPLEGLTSAVTVELDARAVPRIRAATLEDAFRAQGFVHAQERFFQMDLARRSAAGEVAELFGTRALGFDRARRALRLRARAQALLAELPERHRAWLAAYTDGVNAGLADLSARPPEYWVAGAPPAPWSAQDTVLVFYALYTMLSNNEAYERGQGVMRALLPASVYQLLTPTTTRFDRPLLAAAIDPTGGYVPAPIPPPEDFAALARLAAPAAPSTSIDPPLVGPASNQWAIGPARSRSGFAFVANDPHLTLRLPNTFFRSELYWDGGVARGVSIPGLPGILLGATDALAWGATVSNADQNDWVVVETDPADPSRYRTPEGSEPFTIHTESILVRGAAAETVEVRDTRWGPVADVDWQGRPLALNAAAFGRKGLNLDFLEIVLARDVAAGVAVIERWAGPSLNWTLADRDGRIAWAVNGPLPRRVGFDGSRPESWADGARFWQGLHAVPAVTGGGDAVVFTANNRTLPNGEARALSRMWMPSLRAKRIDDLLAEERLLDERASLAMQLDTRAEAYDAIRDLVLEVVAERDADPLLARARAAAADWDGRAEAGDTAFPLLHAYYRSLMTEILNPLIAPAAQADPRFVYRWPVADEPLRRLLEERPIALVPVDSGDWHTWLRAILRGAVERIADGPASLDQPWGAVNALDVAHPLAQVPLFKRWLRLPATHQPGSFVSLRVAAPAYGAQFRMAIAPADPESGILHMSGGQSGHFLSPNFMDQQHDWAAGTATPFLAGPTIDTFVLR